MDNFVEIPMSSIVSANGYAHPMSSLVSISAYSRERRDSLLKRYNKALEALPPAGEGKGCHTALLSVANYGRIARVTPEQVFSDLSLHITGSREVSDSEIHAAIDKAFAPIAQSVMPAIRPQIRREFLDDLIRKGQGTKLKDIVDASPVCLDNRGAALLMRHLYASDELIFCGERQSPGVLGSTIRRALDWYEILLKRLTLPPHIIPNPLTGLQGRTKDGKLSLRADACVAKYRFAVVEFDNLSREEQYAFWAAVPLPIAALIDTGGKSIHGWIRVDAANATAWERDVEVGLFEERLVPLGVDKACKNEARLSRLPDHFRIETGKTQTLIYLAPPGKAVMS